jgi:hypothetical protein
MKQTNRQAPLEQNRIVVWDPSGSEKNWLINAFAKELETINQLDQSFRYELLESVPGAQDPIAFNPGPPGPTASFVNEYHCFIFRRMQISQQLNGPSLPHFHEICMLNTSGWDVNKGLQDRAYNESTLQPLVNAKHIVLILGIPRVSSFQTPQSHSTDIALRISEPEEVFQDSPFLSSSERLIPDFPGISAQDWSSDDYLRVFQLLFAIFGNQPQRNISVCLMKADQQSFRGDTWSVFQRRFGNTLYKLLQFQAQYHHIEISVTSAVGYLRQGGITIPNYLNGNLRDEDNWKPVNTTGPFFWLFEQIEQERMQNSRSLFSQRRRQSLPYPKTPTYW